MTAEDLERLYKESLERLAQMLKVEYSQLVNFCGEIEDGGFAARRLREFFTQPPVSFELESIIRISEQYKCLSGG